MSQRWLRRLVVLLVLTVIALTLRYTVFRADPVSVTVFRVSAGKVEETITNSRAGTVKSRRRASLSAELGGRVAELPVHKGDGVRKGEVLFRLANDDFKAQLLLQERSREAARAAEREACTAAEQAGRDLLRYRQLAEEKIVSVEILDRTESRYQTSTSACEAARARTLQADAAVKLARVNLEKTVVTAPFDGVVAELTVELGEWITPSPPGIPIPAVVELIDVESVYLSAPLDEVDVGRVKTGQAVRVSLDAYPGRSFPGKVVRVARYVQDIQEQNRTFEIEVDLEDAAFARSLVPGSSADVEVVLGTRDGVLRVPSSAIQEGGKVLVVRDETLAEVPVKTGLRNWEFTEILEGLSARDLVVVTLDRAEIQAGARVRVEGEFVP